MKTPWQMSLHELRAHHQAQVEENLRMLETAKATPAEQKQRHRQLIGHRSAAGDQRRLRAIPVYTEGVPGVIPGTNPLAEVLRQERKLADDR